MRVLIQLYQLLLGWIKSLKKINGEFDTPLFYAIL